MKMIEMLLKEMEQEAQTTRKMLALVPFDKLGWKPHPKSMTIEGLATHIAELPDWVRIALTTEELDFAKNPYKMEAKSNTSDLLAFFKENLEKGFSHLNTAKEEDLLPEWTLRNGSQVLSVSSKAEVIRMTFCQIVHHRAQMGVYLRLLNIPIPGSYGPSADELGL